MRKTIYSLILVLVVTLIIVYTRQNLNYTAPVSDLTTRVVQPKPVVTLPPLESLGKGARLPTEQELEQEKKDDAKQIELAVQQLKSPEVQQRIAATEQLNAYQTLSSEQHLSYTLFHDTSVEVRKSAAQSLAYFSHLSEPTLIALIKSLNDTNPTLRFAGLNALYSYCARVNTDPQKFQFILEQLRNTTKSRRLPQDIRRSLQAFIKDQEPTKNIFFALPEKPKPKK